jgi:hypothetical protein
MTGPRCRWHWVMLKIIQYQKPDMAVAATVSHLQVQQSENVTKSYLSSSYARTEVTIAWGQISLWDWLLDRNIKFLSNLALFMK